jgi:TatD DNase family protein
MLIDTHAHLMLSEFDGDRAEVIARAKEKGLKAIINVGCDIKSSKESVKMADGEFIYGTLGLSPYDAMYFNQKLAQEWEKIILKDKEDAKKTGRKKLIAIGETGLDYFKAKVTAEIQKKAFEGHLDLAQKTNLPVIVHNREADEDCWESLRKFPEVKGVFHCYGTSLEFAKRLWNAGYTTSFTAIITYPNAKELRAVVKEVPMDKFFVETDSPYLAPQNKRGQRNEPAYLEEVLKCIAEIKGLDIEKLKILVEENSRNFFGI